MSKNMKAENLNTFESYNETVKAKIADAENVLQVSVVDWKAIAENEFVNCGNKEEIEMDKQNLIEYQEMSESQENFESLSTSFKSESQENLFESNKKNLEDDIQESWNKKEYEKCVNLLEEMEMIEENSNYVAMKIDCLLFQGKIDEAREIARKIFKKDPQSCDGAFFIAKCHLHEGDLSLAIEKFDQIIRKYQNIMLWPHIQRERDNAEKLLKLLKKGQRYFWRRDCVHALTAFTEALKLSENNKRVKETIYINRGMTRKYLKRYELALCDFNEALKLSTDDPLIYHRRVLCLYECGHYQECETECIQALKLKDCKVVKKLLKKSISKLSNLKGKQFY